MTAPVTDAYFATIAIRESGGLRKRDDTGTSESHRRHQRELAIAFADTDTLAARPPNLSGPAGGIADRRGICRVDPSHLALFDPGVGGGAEAPRPAASVAFRPPRTNPPPPYRRPRTW